MYVQVCSLCVIFHNSHLWQACGLMVSSLVSGLSRPRFLSHRLTRSTVFRFVGYIIVNFSRPIFIYGQAVVFDGEEQAYQSVMNGKASYICYQTC